MPSRRAEDACATLTKALLGAGLIVDLEIDPLGHCLNLMSLTFESAEELALRIEAGTEARVIKV